MSDTSPKKSHEGKPKSHTSNGSSRHALPAAERKANKKVSESSGAGGVGGGSFDIGDRVGVHGADGTVQHGTLRFLGTPQFASGTWAGIELDGPNGKNDGSVQGIRYFECPAGHGIFCKKQVLRKADDSPKKSARASLAQRRSVARSHGGDSDVITTTITIPGSIVEEPTKSRDKSQDKKAGKLSPASSQKTGGHRQRHSNSKAGTSREARSSSCGSEPIVPDGRNGDHDHDHDHDQDEAGGGGGGGEADHEKESEEFAILPPVPKAVESTWEKKVRQLAYRGIHLGRILGFYQSLATGALRDAKGHKLLPHYDPKLHTTNDVVRMAIIPASRGTRFGDVAFSTLAQDNKSTLATVMVSHHWRNLFCHLVASMIAFALGDTTYESVVDDLIEHRFEDLRLRLDRRDALQMAFWGCLFCVNQHISICGGFVKEPEKGQENYQAAIAEYKRNTEDPASGKRFPLCSCPTKKHWNDSPLCEMDKFDAMMAVLHAEAPKVASRCHHVIVVDRKFEVFSRIWVMAEIAKGQELELTQHAMLYTDDAEVLNGELSHVKDTLDIRNCTASRQEDVDAILASIKDIDGFNTKLNNVLFNEKSGLLETWSAERCAGFFDVIDPLKDLFTGLHWHAPEVITIGQESTGKSTLMERLTGIPVFPRDSDLCTRSIIKVRLRRGPARDLRVLVEDWETRQETLCATVTLEDVGKTVMREMTRQVRLETLRNEQPHQPDEYYEKSISEEPLQPSDGICTEKVLIVEVTSPTAPNLDIVDCPGLVAASARGRPANIVADTASLVRKYAERNAKNALFIITVKASEQPNNSLAMQMVQELELEDRTLGVLTMSDILAGDLSEKGTTLNKTFVKYHSQRLWSLLRGESDEGGGVNLGLGYIMTALNDVGESKGWCSRSRIDAMSTWEHTFFSALCKQWPEQVPQVDKTILKDLVTCNSVWKHVKTAVDDFVRNHWLSQTWKLVWEEEAQTHERELALGLPRSLSVDHGAELLRRADVLPGSLKDSLQIDPVADRHAVKEMFITRAQEIIAVTVSNMWTGQGVIHDLVVRFEERFYQLLPDKLVAEKSARTTAIVSPADAPEGERRGASRKRTSIFDMRGRLEEPFDALAALLRDAILEARSHVGTELQRALASDTSEARLGRMGGAIVALVNACEEHLGNPAEGQGACSPDQLRSALGVAAGCGLDASPWVRVERVAGQASFTMHVDREQIVGRCLLLLHNTLDYSHSSLAELVQSVCTELPEECWTEDCSEERFQLLERLQQLRLAQARLRDGFGEDVDAIEEKVAQNEDQGLFDQVAVQSLYDQLQERTWHKFTEEQVEPILVQLAQGIPVGQDAINSPVDDCILWNGSVVGEGQQACLQMVRPGQNVATDAFVTRLLVYFFASDDFMAALTNQGNEALPMRCGDQRCVNMHHISIRRGGQRAQ